MIIKPYSYNGVLLNSTDYDTSYPRSSALAQGQVNLSYTQRASAEPIYAGKDFQPVTMNLEIQCLHDYTVLQEQLNTLFDVHDETPRVFVVQDIEDTSAENPKQYYVYATTKQILGGHDGGMVTVTLGFDGAIWRSVTENSQAWNVSASGSTTDFINNGNSETYPIFEVVITGYAATGYTFNKYIEYKPPSAYAWKNRPLEIVATTDGIGLDTAALVAAGKVLASGDDFRVYVDGVEVDRWFGGAGFNTTDTKVWINIDEPIARTMLLKSAIASTDTPTEIEFTYSAAAKIAFGAMPNIGRFVIGTEEFTYTSKTITTKQLIAEGITRAVRNSTAANHSSSDTVSWIPYDINILYGNASASAPFVDDTRKPIINLTTSTNQTFVYTYYSDIAKLRSGIWMPSIVKLSNSLLSRSSIYTSENNAADADPSDTAGMFILPYQFNGVYKAETSILQWLGYFPNGVTSVSYTYERYQGTATFPNAAGLYSSILGTSYKATKLHPSSDMPTTDLGTWVTGTYATTDITIPAGTRYLKYQMSGSVKANANDAAYLGMTSTTVNMTNPAACIIRGEASNYLFDVTIANSETGKSMNVKYPLQSGQILYIDTDPDFPTAKFMGQIVNGAITTDTIRADWLSFKVGTNTLTVTSDAVGSFSITAKWRDRMNLL